MVAGDLVGRRDSKCGKGRVLVLPELQRQLRVLERVVACVTDELVVLDQAVVRVGGESERRKFQRIDGWQLVQFQLWIDPGECREVMAHDIVSEDEGRALGECVEALDGGGDLLPGQGNAFVGVRSPAGQFVNGEKVIESGFDIQAQTSRRERRGGHHHLTKNAIGKRLDWSISRSGLQSLGSSVVSHAVGKR